MKAIGKVTYSEDKDFKLRNKNRVAEPKAIEYLDRRMIPFIRTGIDALDCDAPIWNIPPFIRSMPDYIIFVQSGSPHSIMFPHGQPLFFETKGFVGMVKLKIRDLKNYRKWNDYLKIIFFLYDIRYEAYGEVMFDELVKIIKEKKPEIKSYPEHPENTYYEIPVHWLPNFTNF